MHDTTMDRFAEKQEEIKQRCAEASSHYPTLWSQMIAEWNQPDPEDRVWLMYSANYLFRTNDIRWAIDPITLNWRIKNAPKVDVARDLSSLCFVLLTHDHKDHLDLDLLAALRQLPITWVVPEFMLSEAIDQAGLPRENIMIASPLSPLQLHGIDILPFDGLHWETTTDGRLKGLPSMGYLIERSGRRWLFPGDVRTYDASQLPAFVPVDILFSHLWLGRNSALLESPPLLNAFCRFISDLNPRRLILTHLDEFGRDANDFWDASHAQRVSTNLKEIEPGIAVTPACMGANILLCRPP